MSNLKKHANAKGQSYPHLYFNEETKEYWAVVRVGKKIRKRSLQTKQYLEAIGKIGDVIVDLSSEDSNSKKERETNKLLKDFWVELKLEKKSNDVKQSTMIRTESVWKHHLDPYLGNWRPDQVKPDMIPAFVEWHRAKFKGQQLMNVYKGMTNLFGYMVRVGALQVSQVPRIKIPKAEKRHHLKKKGRIITKAERDALLSRGSEQFRLAVGIAEALGMRKMEILSLKHEQLVSEGERYFVELSADDTKTGLARIIPMPRHLKPLLLSQIGRSYNTPFLFPSKGASGHLSGQVYDKEWTAVKKQAGIKGRLRTHDWRHTRATSMAKQNINPIIACTLLGMTIQMYQKVYAQLTGRDLVDTVDKMLEGTYSK